MADLTGAQRTALAAILARCTTPLLAQVDAMAAVISGQKAVGLRRLLSEVARERHRQDMVLAPMDPLFRPRKDGLSGLSFPDHLRAQLWQLAISHEPQMLEHLDRGDQVSRTVADRLCLSAAMGVRDFSQGIWPEAASGQVEVLATCLDLMGIARRYLTYLADSLRGGSSEATAELKFAMKQAAAIHDAAPSLLLEILFAHTDEARFFLRLLNQLQPNMGPRRLTAGPDPAVFVTRLAEGVLARCHEIVNIDPMIPEANLIGLKQKLEWSAEVLSEMDANSQLRPDPATGQALRQSRMQVSKVLSDIFTDAEQAVIGLLSVETTVLTGRMKRPIPRLDQPVDAQVVAQAKRLLTVVGLSRGPALVFGREADRRQTAEGLTWRLASWADEAIDRVNEGLVEDLNLACSRIGVAADLLALIDAREAARSIRRRLMVMGTRYQDIQDATSGASRQSA